MALVALGIAWLVGIYAASQVTVPAIAVLPFVALGVVAAVLFRQNALQRWAALCLTAALLGFLRYDLARPRFDQSSLATYNNRNQPVTVVGVVVAEPDVRDTYIALRVQVESARFGSGMEQPVRGLALVRAPRTAGRDYFYGDRLSITGWLESPPVLDDFDYRAYLARQGVYSQIGRPQIELIDSGHGFAPYRWLLTFKAHVKSVIAQILPEPQASLLTGILLGVEAGIPPNVQEAFRITGTSHVIAISGFNMTLLAGLLSAAAVRLFDRRYEFYVIVAGLWLYTILVGAAASVVRAAIMSALYIWGKHVGRQSAALNSLFAAAILMTLLDAYTLQDVGFQLSFAATLGLILYTDRIEALFDRALRRFLSAERARQIVGMLNDALVVTLAAQVTTLPILVYVFRQLSPVSLLTNLFVLPAQPGVMLSGGAATLAGLIWLPLGQVMGWVAWVFLSWTIGVIELTSRLPGASLNLGRVDAAWIIAYYIGLAALTVWYSLPVERRIALRSRVAARLSARRILSGLAIVAVLAGAALVKLPDGKLHVDFLDVGQGDAVFVQTPSGRQVLIDAGNRPSLVLDRLGRRLPFWDHALDVAVIARADDAHLMAWTALLERYQVGLIIAPPILSGSDASLAPTTPTALRLKQLFAEKHAQVTPSVAGLKIQLDAGVELQMVSAPISGTAASTVRLSCGNVSFLLAGASAPSQGWPASTVLRLAEQGSAAANPAEMLAAVNPAVVIISVEADNRANLPSPLVLARLTGRTVFRTDRHGSINISTDGMQLWLQPERFD